MKGPSRFHVTSVLNRVSVATHGLDYTRMGPARGIAGSLTPEQEGTFLADGESETQWFVDMNNTGGPVDVWEVRGVDGSLLVETNGYFWLPGAIPANRVSLLRQDVPPQPRPRT